MVHEMSITSLEILSGHSQCTDLGSSSSTLDSSEQQHPIIQRPRVRKSSSFKLLRGKIAKALKVGGSAEEKDHLPDSLCNTYEASKPVRARLVLKRSKDSQNSLPESIKGSKSERKVAPRRKSLFGMSDGLSVSTQTHKTPKRKSLTPTNSQEGLGNGWNKALVSLPSGILSHSSSLHTKACGSLSPNRRNSLSSNVSIVSPRNPLEDKCVFPIERRQPHFETLLFAPQKSPTEKSNKSRTNLTMQEIIDEYNKIAGE